MGLFNFRKLNRMLHQIETLTKNGELSQARALLEPLRQQNPRDATLLLYAAAIEFEDKQLALAEQLIGEGLKLQKDNPVLHLALGEVLWQQKKYPEARQSLHQALHLSPGHPKIEYLLGLISIAQGRLDEATLHFEQVAREDLHFLQARLLTLAEARHMQSSHV